ncbi:MBL fold metallo-hydrolase [Selenomonadales bacterium OttesenSCG-928-I06]|nr:MBL fold metallo-hydrolase [Selenomonadales bacterium OttesenSCG-928-I06]
MQINILASGSKGNATLIQTEDTKILIDAGISTTKMKNSLESLNVDLKDIDAVLLTHEHQDHIKGLPVLSRKYNIKIFATPKTWQTLDCKESLRREFCYNLNNSLDFSDLKIEPFSISHDAADPVGYNFYNKSFKLSFATDLGIVSPTVKQAISMSDALVLEANHDSKMLKTGPYPTYLKNRISSNKGHLANTDTGWTLARLNRKNHTKVFLAHISETNNDPILAKNTVTNILENAGVNNDEIDIEITYQNKVTGCRFK